MKKTARTPTSEAGKRIAAIFHRQLTTKWSEKEIDKFRRLVKDGIDLTDLALIERCYKKQWPPNRDKNILRHDLMTFLNNFETERDRAVAWNELHPSKPPPRKIIPMRLPEIPAEPLTDEDVARINRLHAEFRQRTGRELNLPRPQNAFQKVRQIMKGDV